MLLRFRIGLADFDFDFDRGAFADLAGVAERVDVAFHAQPVHLDQFDDRAAWLNPLAQLRDPVELAFDLPRGNEVEDGDDKDDAADHAGGDKQTVQCDLPPAPGGDPGGNCGEKGEHSGKQRANIPDGHADKRIILMAILACEVDKARVLGSTGEIFRAAAQVPQHHHHASGHQQG